jgi:hypothetical protein
VVIVTTGGGTISIVGNSTIISNGNVIGGTSVNFLSINVPGGTVNLGDAFLSTIKFTAGTFNTNNFSVAGSLNSTGSSTRTLNMGSSTWTTNVNGWNVGTATGMTFNAGTSTINLANASVFNGGSLTYNNLVLAYSAANIDGSNTFNTISNSVQPTTVSLTAGTTQTVTNFNLSGTAGNLVTIKSDTAGTQATISKPSGVANPQYLSIQDINATGGAAWNAQYSTDAGNNSGWNFGNAFAAFL